MLKMEVFDAPSHYYPSDAMSLDELSYWITFNRVSGIGPISFKSLLEYFDNNLEAAWRADTIELAQAGLTRNTIEYVVRLRKTSTPQKELEKLEKLRSRPVRSRCRRNAQFIHLRAASHRTHRHRSGQRPGYNR